MKNYSTTNMTIKKESMTYKWQHNACVPPTEGHSEYQTVL